MRAESIGSLGASTVGAAPLVRSKRLGDYWALTKPDVNILSAGGLDSLPAVAFCFDGAG
jgi:hypothetical protein